MKKFIAAVLIALTLLSPATAFADPPVQPPGKIAPLHETDPAPFDGVLFSAEAVAWVAAQSESFEERVQIERQDATAQATAHCDRRIADADARSEADRATMQAQLDAQQARLETMERALRDEEKKRKPGTIALWTSLGTGGGILLTLGTIFLVNQATK